MDYSGQCSKIGAMEKLKQAAEKLGIFLTSFQLGLFETYYRELTDWNKRINLTGITDYEEVQIKHFLDSLTIAAAIKNIKRNLKMADIGTGAGLPGIPLKIVFQDIELNMNNVAIVAERAETAAHDTQYREKSDIVVSRAVAPLPALVELMLPFCGIGGWCIVQKKGNITREIEQSRKAITVMGGNLREVKSVELEELSDDRWLLVIEKLLPTPPNYPRRPGMPEKRPVIS
jgi:16S rRNA (guanine527-N7)-methyltransferase